MYSTKLVTYLRVTEVAKELCKPEPLVCFNLYHGHSGLGPDRMDYCDLSGIYAALANPLTSPRSEWASADENSFRSE